MQLQYCRHCKLDVPMFNDDEKAQLQVLFSKYLHEFKGYRRVHDVPMSEVPKEVLTKEFREKYYEFSGIEMEFTIEEVMSRHYISRWSRDWRQKKQ